MAKESSSSLISPAPADRRPAIWPWLVMPLVTLALFYGLDKLKQSQDRGPFSAAPQTSASAPAEAGAQ